MDKSTILASLNPAQAEAVQAPLSHQLVLAGAGSGKTRVLVHRLLWLIEVEQLSPASVLAVTFTNKAANEMRERVASLSSLNAKDMWIGTFHGLSHRLLRRHWMEANLPQAFQILDSDDQLRMIRRAIVALNIDEERFAAKDAQWFINAQKEKGLEPHQVIPEHHADHTYLKIYEAYQAACQRAGVIDFADLLLKTTQLLQSHDDLRAHYQERFRSVLVDEFQDTNAMQYAWLKLFVGDKNALMIVGDDDQSIYGWRGAKIENIRHFADDFPTATLTRLEQNYRSTDVILQAANALIAQNTGRLGKNLWTDTKAGESISLYAAQNEIDEARFVVRQIKNLCRSRHQERDIAILYRSNAQSRVIEELLMQNSIPYRIYGGLRFFDRAEIRDTLAYLRLVTNSADDTAFERIINFPTRGIGDRTLATIREHAQAQSQPLMVTLEQLLSQQVFATRTASNLQSFVDLIRTLSEAIAPEPLHKQIEIVIHLSGLMEHYRNEKGEKRLTRIENLDELVNAAHQFAHETADPDMPPLISFLSFAALESSTETGNAENSVQLMTLHAAKGLEFPIVFLIGCEEELFPHFLSMHEPKKLEEERRLCYVGITRAMQKLFLSYATTRFMHGKRSYHRPSRFLKELPEKLISIEEEY
jgi:DNA helicase-2/ATP-dependent DNA helicase PcrA